MDNIVIKFLHWLTIFYVFTSLARWTGIEWLQKGTLASILIFGTSILLNEYLWYLYFDKGKETRKKKRR